MSIWRKLGKFSGGLLFTFFLAASITIGSFSQLLGHDNLKSVSASLISEQFPKQEMSMVTSEMKSQCKQRDSVQFSLGQQSFSFDCRQMENATDEDITNMIIGQAFDSIYFKNYGCTFVECMQKPGEEKLMVLVSANAYKFFSDIQFALWAGVVLGAVIMLVSIETWDGRLKGFGTSLIFTGLPFVFFNYIQNFVFSLLPKLPASIMPILEKIFSSISLSYFIVLALGIALTIAGYAVAIFSKKEKKRV